MEAVSNVYFGRHIHKFLSIVEDNIKTIKDCPREFESMKKNVVSIQNFVENIKKQKHGIKTLNQFTNEMRELMYELEDITTDYSQRVECMGGDGRLEMGKMLKDVNDKIGTMQTRMEKFQNNKNIVLRRPCDPINDVTQIVGVGDVVTKIKEWILNEDKDIEGKYNCIGLVGKGGSGKTTLAQMILEDEDIKEYFHLLVNDDKMMFVTISQQVDVKTIMKNMLKELEVKIGDDEGNMSSKIYENLKERRYFLILDDVWNLDGGWWETIKNALPQGSQNSILITSRMRNIVQDMGVVENQIHELEALGEQDSWTLFCKNISTDDVSENTELREIGMEIVRKCAGLPLAIKVMSRVVSSCDISTSEWKRIRDKFMEYLSNNENDSEAMGSLELSYDDLPEGYLQQCLLYFALFPKGFEIEKDKMIRWWIGEGFVPLEEDGRVSVESAEQCFEELVNRSLIDVHQIDCNWKVLTCKLHDLVRQMLIRKGKCEPVFENQISRRLVVSTNDDIHITNEKISLMNTKFSKLRAVVSFSSKQIQVTEEFLDKIYDDCRYLRVLDLSEMFSKSEDHMLSRIETLKHLMYLNVEDFCTYKVPTEICQLKSLLILCLKVMVDEFPDSITELRQLIWLDVSGCSHLKYLPKGLGNVSTLQVLKGFVLPSSSTDKEGCRFEELRNLTQLVTLEMKITDSKFSDSELDSLSELECLRHLSILCTGTPTSVVQKLDNLVLPKKLYEVNLLYYPEEETIQGMETFYDADSDEIIQEMETFYDAASDAEKEAPYSHDANEEIKPYYTNSLRLSTWHSGRYKLQIPFKRSIFLGSHTLSTAAYILFVLAPLKFSEALIFFALENVSYTAVYMKFRSVFVWENIKVISSFVSEKIKAFKDCHSQFKLMTKNEKVIEKFVEDVKKQNHDLKTVGDFTKKMEELMNEIEVIKKDYSRMGKFSRFRIGKKLKDFNENFKKLENDMTKMLELAIQNRREVIDPVAEFELMKKNVVTIQKFINDIQKVNHGMEIVDEFTNEMRELKYEAEDLMADYSHKEAEDIMEENDRLAMPKKLKDFNDKIKTRQSRMDNFLSIASQNNNRRRPCDPINDDTKIVGLDNVVGKIKKWVLLNNDGDKKAKYNCIGLVGKGGSGKTTLAEMVYKDQEIKQHFHSKVMFVTVSQPVNLKMMMKSMLKQLDHKPKDDVDEQEMSKIIYNSLMGSSYFVILDDVWNLDGGWWETIKSALPKGSENCILITSRKKNIVQHMGVCAERIHVPGELKDEDGWSLFCISAKIDVSEDTKMKQIGMEIVRKCGGLPIAIKVMGGVVSSCEISPPKWMEIRDSFKQYISNNENDIVMGSLGLSYEDLRQTCLKLCLLCFGVFPEDYAIERDTMIRWWIGEGFVPLTEDGRVSVVLAERCFDELVNRSLVEVEKRDYNGKVLECKVHDLVREMLIQKGKSESFFEIGKEKTSRRILLNVDDISTANNQISESKNKVRAIVKCGRGGFVTKEFIDKICDVCKYLRVLDVSMIYSKDHVPKVLSRIEKLKQLTCLCTTVLPTNISKLKSLLVLYLGKDVEDLPSSITELNQLIWLDVSDCYSYMPKGLGNVSTLQVLKGFVPSQKECRFEELRKLTQLVTLEMKIEDENQLSDGELDALSELDCLRHLTIVQEVHRYNKLLAKKLDKLVPPKKLIEVRLICYPGEETPSWLCTEDLPYLRYLYFDGGKQLLHFNEKFHEGKTWRITHLRLNHTLVSRDWKVIRERMPHLNLKTIHSAEGFMQYNCPPEEFDENGVWWGSKNNSMNV